ncbi:uncharacterized protein LOC134246058 [Saccostrea cucullata]|uniref:uncharacterized protein LOC134246058 n=1 Tax=Saccostrea cuccullata TaxID=36930 RepID=UPI002ED17745
MNHGMSKTALSDTLQCEKSSLPQPNYLPGTYKEAKTFISPFLIPLEKYDACVNDCIVYRDSGALLYSDLSDCPVCSEPRKSRKIFTYMPLGPRLARWYETPNLCRLLYAEKLQVRRDGILGDFTDGELFKSWFEPGEIFENKNPESCVPLSLFTDGVNPNKNSACQKSMWPIMLTWITLPPSIRQLLGPMLLMGIIPSGVNGSEPKSLDPYLSIVVDELLTLTEFPVYDSYRSAPTTVKVALLQYLCDIPAYSKVMHLTGHASLRSCPYCRETGHYCKHLRKTIHISNRQFLPFGHPLRSASGFAIDGQEERSKPSPYTQEEENRMRTQYELKPNKTQKANQQKSTGLKGNYILQQLPYHDRMRQMSPDGMHTLADFISHLMEMLVGKQNTQKVMSCEKSFGRFDEVWKSAAEEQASIDRPKKKKKRNVESEQTLVDSTPWSLSKEQIKTADERASSIVYSHSHEITPGPHFTKLWTLRTMNAKLQFVTSGAFEWCIKDLLPISQERTLEHICGVIRRIVSPKLTVLDIAQLQADTHEALSLLERDFPLAIQNLTTHLIHHIVDDLANYGPMYGRWLFPYERANGWVTRQCLRKGMEESTVMETYVIYDWCVYMILSGRFNPCDLSTNEKTLVKTSQQIMEQMRDGFSVSSQENHTKKNTTSQITPEMRQFMMNFYLLNLKLSTVQFSSEVTENYSTLDITDDCGRQIRYIGTRFKGRREPSIVKLPGSGGLLFGRICFFLEHVLCGAVQNWVIVDVYPIAEKVGKYFLFQESVLGQQLFHVSVISRPLVHVKDRGVWIINA